MTLQNVLSKIIVSSLLILSACSSLHNIQIGDIDQTQGTATRFDIKQSETGINISEAAGIAKGLARNKSFSRAAKTVSDVWQALTYGPKTGEVTFSDTYADDTIRQVLEACPSGKITGLMSLRETNKYPVISGEIVRVVGYCINSAKN